MWPEDVSDARDWSATLGHWSTVLGTAGLALGVGALFFPPLGVAAAAVSAVAWGLAGVSTLLSGVGFGWDSSQFKASLGMLTVGGILWGKGQMLKHFGVAEEIGAKISGVASDVGSTVVDWLTW
jgi:hypothetical protein